MPKSRVFGAGSSIRTREDNKPTPDIKDVSNVTQDQQLEPLFNTYNTPLTESTELFKSYNLLLRVYYQIYTNESDTLPSSSSLTNNSSSLVKTGVHRNLTLTASENEDSGVNFHVRRQLTKPPVINADGSYTWSNEPDKEATTEISGYRFLSVNTGSPWEVKSTFHETYIFEHILFDQSRKDEYYYLEVDGTYPDSGNSDITTGSEFYFRITKSIGKYTNLKNGIPKICKIIYNNNDKDGFRTREIQFYGIGGENIAVTNSITSADYNIQESTFTQKTRAVAVDQIYSYKDIYNVTSTGRGGTVTTLIQTAGYSNNQQEFYNADYSNDTVNSTSLDTLYKTSPHSFMFNAFNNDKYLESTRSTLLRMVRTCGVSTQQTWTTNSVTFNSTGSGRSKVNGIDTSSSTSSTLTGNIFLFGDGIPYGTYINTGDNALEDDVSYELKTDFQPYVNGDYMSTIYPNGMTNVSSEGGNGMDLSFPTSSVSDDGTINPINLIVRLIPESELYLTNVAGGLPPFSYTPDPSVIPVTPFGQESAEKRMIMTTYSNYWNLTPSNNSGDFIVLEDGSPWVNQPSKASSSILSMVHNITVPETIKWNNRTSAVTESSSSYVTTGYNYKFNPIAPFVAYNNDYRGDVYDIQNTMIKSQVINDAEATLPTDSTFTVADSTIDGEVRFKDVAFSLRTQDSGTTSVPLYYIIGFGNGLDNTNHQIDKYESGVAVRPAWYYINGKLTKADGSTVAGKSDKLYITDYDLKITFPDYTPN